ncbi:DUF5403 family protein [Streptomyces sp. HU2014]|uniref:DUF5403 family protein n=1 Tax=Streptomyces sp. HU2014 TaxID=2939414 RepID=UPI00200DCE77|nr:DUF5403 family protein [Streptomyces sp. HU2014]UQI46721.1 DUF5403 family protein [Streptomyces sp. HU2014]
MATVRPDLASVVAHMPGVKRAVRRILNERAARIRAVVAAHRDTGALSSSLTVRTNRVDSTVTLEDPAVVAINYGHVAADGRWVEGIHALEAGL